ncbi:MAG: amino acid ABC transporter substrate-binding protein [Candidatus Lokiarchaeota archaeon]|nr:amino acid ABC transporter substrate-binding protein [Candidatus Lokiarchaeota archaeon]
MSSESAVIRREIAIIAIVVGLGVGILGGWFIPSPISETRTSLLDKIIARGELIVGTSADYPPFENKTFPGGVIIGFDIDVSEMIADEIGVTLEMVDIPFDSLIAACRGGTIDMIAAAMTYTAERAESIAPSTTYITVSQTVIAKNASGFTISSINDVTSYVVGVQTGTVMYEELGPDGLGMTVGVELIVYDNANDLMIALDGGGIQLAYVDEPVYTAWANTYDLEVLFSTGSEPLALWTRHGEPEFLYEINKVIFESYQDGSIITIIDTWFG